MFEIFLGRGSAATSNVEGLHTTDGIQVAHMFFWRAEGAKDVVEMVKHLLVSRVSLHLIP